MTTNPILRARIEQYNALRNSLSTINDTCRAERRALTEDEQTHVRHATAELQRLLSEGVTPEEVEQQDREDAATRGAARVYGPAAAERLGHGGPADDLTRAELVPSLMPSRAQLAEALRAVETRTGIRQPVDQSEVQTRAAITTAQTGLGVVGGAGVPLRDPRRIATAVPVTVERVAGITGLAFPVFGAGTAAITAEGAAKQEYAAITAGEATPQTIAVWTDVTRQALMSLPGLETRIRAKLSALVARREDVLMVAQLLAAPGQTLTAPANAAYSDALLAACGLVLSSDVAADPDLILVNPADLPLIFPAATTQGLNGTSPDSAMRLELHGATVYPTSAVTAGSAIVTALGACARYVIGMAPELLVDGGAGLKTNTVTMLMEEAVTLAVDEPSGVVQVDLNGA